MKRKHLLHGQIVTNVGTGESWKVKHYNSQGGVYCENVDTGACQGRCAWFRESDFYEGSGGESDFSETEAPK